MNRILPPKVNRRTRRRYHNGTGDSLSNGALRITGVATSLFGGGKVLQRSREDLVSGDDRVLRERLVMWEVSGAKTGLCQSREIKAVSYKMEVGSPCVHSSGLSLFLPDPTFFFKYYLVLSLPVRLLPTLPHTLDRQRLRPRRRLVKMAKRTKLGKVTTVSALHRVSVSHWGTTVRE